ncbi:MAG: RDD family protein, partial [bacterium]|nr:RDD family protein [bacterium]
LYLVYFFFQWGYFTFFELLKNGQTPGKKAMRICVIKADGESPDASTIVLRNLLRAVDAFPAFHFLGGFVSILDKKSRRLGDIVADTIIVHEIRFQLEEPAFQTKLKSSGMKEPDFAPNVKLNEEELYVIRRFLNQRHLLSTEKQSAIAEKLADKVKTRLKIKKSLNSKNILFLESVYRKHADDDTK